MFPGSAEQRLREEGIRGVIYLFKNNTDSAGNSYGCHENYLVERTVNFHKLAELHGQKAGTPTMGPASTRTKAVTTDATYATMTCCDDQRTMSVRFPAAHGLKVPQIGWNQIHVKQTDCPLFRNISEGTYFYFVHSFFPRPEDDAIIATETDYGGRFASSIWCENVYATQFHPEKSFPPGIRLLKNFLRI